MRPVPLFRPLCAERIRPAAPKRTRPIAKSKVRNRFRSFFKEAPIYSEIPEYKLL